MKTKTERRAEWILTNATGIKLSRSVVTVRARAKGYNARTCLGMSSGGWGWWAVALSRAGIEAGAMRYWSGSAPTPSTAINGGIANYITNNAPADLRG